jgi:hypothetical protein
MPNMGYCMFENTYKDLIECAEALENGGQRYLMQNANQYEKPYIKKLIELCADISDNFQMDCDEEE